MKDKTCSIDGCGRPARHRGLCRAHYRRWQRHGDPLSGGTSRGDAQRWINEVALTFKGDSCLVWPFSRGKDGYGRIKREGRMQKAHRVVCEAAHGIAPTPKHEAAHNCGNRGCINPHHLRWATPVENAADRLIHGTHIEGERHGRAKITEAEAREILALKDKKVQREIGAQFGLDQRTISAIHRKKRWAHLGRSVSSRGEGVTP